MRPLLKKLGWVEHVPATETDTGTGEWNVYWSDFSIPIDYMESCRRQERCCQRMNHFKKTNMMCVKNEIARILKRMQAVHGSKVTSLAR